MRVVEMLLFIYVVYVVSMFFLFSAVFPKIKKGSDIHGQTKKKTLH